MIRTWFGFSLLAVAVASFVYVETEAQAQALQLARPFNGVINKAISSSLGKRLNTMGFAANDPIYGATMAASQTVVAGAVAAGSVAATVAAVGSAPVWLSVALGIGAAYEVYDFAFGDTKYRFTSPSAVALKPDTATASAPAPSPYPATEYTVPPAIFPADYTNPGVGNSLLLPTDLPVCASFSHAVQDSVATYMQFAAPPSTATSGVVCGESAAQLRDLAAIFFQESLILRSNAANANETLQLVGLALVSDIGPTKVSCAINSINCPQGVRYSYTRNYQATIVNTVYGTPSNLLVTVNHNYQVFPNPSYIDTTRTYSLNDAVAKLTATDLNTLADPELLAAMANKIWANAAAQPGYEGAPYDPLSPVTPADILADVAAGLYPHPSVADLLALPSPDAVTLPVFDPAAVPVSAPAPGAQTVTVDLGADPGIVAPGLEEVPTGASILTHVMALLPSVSAFTIPAHVSECVMPSFDFFGHAMTMQGACDLIEQQRALLSTLFTAIWGIAGLVTVLRA